MGILSVSIDLDEIRSYLDIHGLPRETAEDVVYNRAVQRAGDLFAELGVQGTFFVVGKDLQKSEVAQKQVKDLHLAGHEIGNHTWSHRYDLTALHEDIQATEIDDNAAIIHRLTGIKPVGFRAPGYNIHTGLLDMLEKRGYSYDSSVFPCPAYYAAKVAAMGILGLSGRVSGATIGDPQMLNAPCLPYRTGRDGFWTTGSGILELPISVVTRARLPFIGTALVLAGRIGSPILCQKAAQLSFVNLELHGIDFLDAKGDGLEDLAKHQPDLKVPYTKKREILRNAMQILLNRQMQSMTLAEAAGRLII